MRLLRSILIYLSLIIGALCAFSGAGLASAGGSVALVASLISAATAFGAFGIWLVKDEI